MSFALINVSCLKRIQLFKFRQGRTTTKLNAVLGRSLRTTKLKLQEKPVEIYLQLVQCWMLGKRVVAKLAYAVVTEIKSSQQEHAINSLSLNLTDLVVMTETDIRYISKLH